MTSNHTKEGNLSELSRLLLSVTTLRLTRYFKWLSLFGFIFSFIGKGIFSSQKQTPLKVLSIGKHIKMLFMFILVIWVKFWRFSYTSSFCSLRAMFLFRSYRKYCLFRYHESSFDRVSYSYDRSSVYKKTLYQFYLHFFTRTLDTYHSIQNNVQSVTSELSSSVLSSKDLLLNQVLLAKRTKNKQTRRF